MPLAYPEARAELYREQGPPNAHRSKLVPEDRSVDQAVMLDNSKTLKSCSSSCS
jgi:hypothetical protein